MSGILAFFYHRILLNERFERFRTLLSLKSNEKKIVFVDHFVQSGHKRRGPCQVSLVWRELYQLNNILYQFPVTLIDHIFLEISQMEKETGY